MSSASAPFPFHCLCVFFFPLHTGLSSLVRADISVSSTIRNTSRPPPAHLSDLSSSLFTVDTFDIRLKTSTPALYPSGHTSTLNCQCCFRSQKICFFFLSLSFLALIILFCSFLILLRSFTFMKFRLKIGAMHCQFVMLFICVFLEKGKKTFFQRQK